MIHLSLQLNSVSIIKKILKNNNIDPKKIELMNYKNLPHTIRYASEPDRMVEALEYAIHYTDADKKRFEGYLASQLDKIKLPNKDDSFLRNCLLNMYANPLRNKIAAE